MEKWPTPLKIGRCFRITYKNFHCTLLIIYSCKSWVIKVSILCCPHFSVLTVRKRGRLSDWPSSAPAHICRVSPRYMMVTGYLCPDQLQIFCKFGKYFHMSSTWQRREPGCGDRWQCITCHVSRVTWRVSPVSGPARDWAGTGGESGGARAHAGHSELQTNHRRCCHNNG